MTALLGNTVSLLSATPQNTQIDTIFCIIFLVYGLIAIIFAVIIMYAIVKQLQIPHDSQIILSICCGDVIFSTTLCIYLSASLANNQFPWGEIGCVLNVIFIIIGLGGSILSLLLMTLHRYLIVLHRRHLTQDEVYMAIAIAWSIPIVIIVTTAFFTDKFALQPSHLYCMVSFAGAKDDASLSLTIIIFTVLSGCICFTIFAYYSIYIRFRELYKKSRKKADTAQKEKLLILKCVSMCAAFLTCWAPYCLKICIEYTTHEPVSHAFDVICDFTAASNPCLNAIILFKLDSKVRNNLLELVGRNRSSLASQASKLALSTSRISPPSIAVVINRSILSNGGGPKSPKAVRTAPASPSVEQDPSAPVFQKEEVDPVDSMMPSISNLQSLHVKEAKVEQ